MIEYYKCILGGDSFTLNKIYKIRNPHNLEDYQNFRNDKGFRYGWAGDNWKHFTPSTEKEWLLQEGKLVITKTLFKI